MELSTRLRDRISHNLARFEHRPLPAGQLRRAAVSVVIVDQREAPGIGGLKVRLGDERTAALLLTIRASGLKRHAGQRALPGGRLDAGESAVEAALRELEEEVGLTCRSSDVLGRLDDYATRSGFVITPFVVWAGETPDVRADPAEVESVHRIPFSELLREDAPILEHGGSEHPVLKMPVGNDWIAAPTAAIAYQFREVALLGLDTRVAHFEQPRFAWR